VHCPAHPPAPFARINRHPSLPEPGFAGLPQRRGRRPERHAAADLACATNPPLLLARLRQRVAKFGDEAEGQEIQAALGEYPRSCDPSSTGTSGCTANRQCPDWRDATVLTKP